MHMQEGHLLLSEKGGTFNLYWYSLTITSTPCMLSIGQPKPEARPSPPAPVGLAKSPPGPVGAPVGKGAGLALLAVPIVEALTFT